MFWASSSHMVIHQRWKVKVGLGGCRWKVNRLFQSNQKHFSSTTWHGASPEVDATQSPDRNLMPARWLAWDFFSFSFFGGEAENLQNLLTVESQLSLASSPSSLYLSASVRPSAHWFFIRHRAKQEVKVRHYPMSRYLILIFSCCTFSLHLCVLFVFCFF